MSVQHGKAPLVLAIAGCSGSGKTTIAEELARTLGGVHFPLDNYYRDLGYLRPAERALVNFDDPAVIERSLLAAHVAALARGETIQRPLYDFATHTRVPDRTETIRAGDVLLVEGIFALCYPELLPLYHFRIFVDTPDSLCYERRLRRDTVERGRSPESVRRQYDTAVRPAAEQWIRPSAAHADLVLNGADELDWKVERVLNALRPPQPRPLNLSSEELSDEGPASPAAPMDHARKHEPNQLFSDTASGDTTPRTGSPAQRFKPL